MASNCIFCKFVNNTVPCCRINENDSFLAFLDNFPFTQGHSLIIPKQHYRWVYDVPDFAEYWQFTLDTTRKIQHTLSPPFITYLTMGNQVEHAHIHLIPRYPNDVFTGHFDDSLRQHPSLKDLSQIAAKINI